MEVVAPLLFGVAYIASVVGTGGSPAFEPTSAFPMRTVLDIPGELLKMEREVLAGTAKGDRVSLIVNRSKRSAYFRDQIAEMAFNRNPAFRRQVLRQSVPRRFLADAYENYKNLWDRTPRLTAIREREELLGLQLKELGLKKSFKYGPLVLPKGTVRTSGHDIVDWFRPLNTTKYEQVPWFRRLFGGPKYEWTRPLEFADEAVLLQIEKRQIEEIEMVDRAVQAHTNQLSKRQTRNAPPQISPVAITNTTPRPSLKPPTVETPALAKGKSNPLRPMASLDNSRRAVQKASSSAALNAAFNVSSKEVMTAKVVAKAAIEAEEQLAKRLALNAAKVAPGEARVAKFLVQAGMETEEQMLKRLAMNTTKIGVAKGTQATGMIAKVGGEAGEAAATSALRTGANEFAERASREAAEAYTRRVAAETVEHATKEVAEAGAKRIATGALQTVGGFVPLVGEAIDAYILFHPESTMTDRAFAVGSLGLNAITLGFAPNFGGAAKLVK